MEIDELDTISAQNWQFPADSFSLLCAKGGDEEDGIGPVVRQDLEVLIQARSAALEEGWHASLYYARSLGTEVWRVENNLNLERERLRVLERLLSHEESQDADISALPAPQCAAASIRALSFQHMQARGMRSKLATWCDSLGAHGCATANPQQNPQLIRVIEDLKDRSGAITDRVALQISELEALSHRLDNATIALQALEQRLIAMEAVLPSWVAAASGAEVLLGGSVQQMSTCGDAGLAVETAQHTLEREIRLAADAHANLPMSPPSQLRRTGPCYAALHVAHMIDYAETCEVTMQWWHETIMRRVNALGLAWKLLSNHTSALHLRLRDYGGAEYRRRSFEELYANERWGERGSSGRGSELHLTKAIAPAVVDLLVRHGVRRVLDIGCGYGQWLPPTLCDARLTKQGRLHYIGWDLARQPVEALRESAIREWANCDVDWEFHVRDAVEQLPPSGLELVIVRHVLQHLGHRDALRLLRNLRGAAPRLVLITHVPGATNEDLDDVHGGCSAFGHASHTGRVFTGYDLLKPPFGLPAPLEELQETHKGNVMLLFRGVDLPARAGDP
eukprot:gnl/TRDRNA2_/TRDRNA2_91708_c0_seq1.p1 gnl/TRDRNA2_/TRDRNA2_91708_c0~~gnl/TRDRNA2_/TRDRNA2_91708_c0_seq1.p1  ORF type:complete len:574 (+),score=60.79 gnl/TRDRNA2_/TRDRNA2_91708_c0_seq1:32-1723(+)